MKITFLGTGGGRFATISQKRMSGGFRIDDIHGFNLHVDPGPGALIRSLQYKLNPSQIDGIFISHCHTDHYNDAEILIESMTKGMIKNHGHIIGSKSVMEGVDQWGPSVSQYHKTNSETYSLNPDDLIELDKFKLKATKTMHGDPYGVGFQIDTGRFKLSYTSDTKYFEELGECHKGADILIGSVLRPGDKGLKGHMCCQDFENLVKEVEPKLAIMTHFGYKFLKGNPISEAKNIKWETGVRTLAATDGMCVDIDYKNPRKSYVKTLKPREIPGKFGNEIFKL